MNLTLPPYSAFATLPLIWLIATIGAFQLGSWLNRRGGGMPIINPVLIAITLIISVLLALEVDYATYLKDGGGLIGAILGPATVALAVPLYNNARLVRRAMLPLICGVIVGGAVAAASAFALAWLLDAPDVVLRSIVMKSVTAPIAIGVAEQIGGLASLAAAFAVLTGVAGTVLSTWLLGLAGVQSWPAQGLAAGVTAHGQGTARMLTLNETAGAFSSVGMGLNAMLTAIWLPALIATLYRP
ncbi:LrgB family protein [Methylobacterium iners]|uniref:Inner membrane protein YohK n=1 Tax=Methylobacterium iners TaxID=418707 RepID=A0ABQ4S761_9HYPH|nr:LrgB family protein [Methylobacterium iners]GJD97709.1 Inner membrane protein YohK [Methylobacterium iners]